MYESACEMVEDFPQTERASRLKLSYYVKIGQKEMVVLYVVSKIGQNICVGYDPNNGQLPSRMQNELVNSQFIDQNLSFTYNRHGQPIAGSQVQVAR